MRKQIKISLAILGTFSSACANDVVSHTFFSTRPVFQSAMPEKITDFHHDRACVRDEGWGGAFQIVPFGGRSTRSSELNTFFGPSDKDQFSVRQAAGTGIDPTEPLALNNNLGRDINPAFFNIRGNQAFDSNIKFKPRQTFYGVGFDWLQYIGRKNSCPKRWWFEMSFPVVHISNDMRLIEEVITPADQAAVPAPAGTNANMVEAFRGLNAVGGEANNWKFGKIDGSQKKTGVADIELKLGYATIQEECAYLNGYIGFLAPTSNRPTAEYLFEPITGHNGHWAIMTGGLTGFELWSCGDKNLWVEVESNARYFFERSEVRSFDLIGKPWSRYMTVYTSPDNALDGVGSPGINVFTTDFKVKPRWYTNITTGLVYNSRGFKGEVGYNVWARQAEKVELKNSLPTGATAIALADAVTPPVQYPAGEVVRPVNRARTIRDNFTSIPGIVDCPGGGEPGCIVPVDACEPGEQQRIGCFIDDNYQPNSAVGCGVGFSPTCSAIGSSVIARALLVQEEYIATGPRTSVVTDADIDLNSVAMPASLSHIFYASAGYNWDCWCYPTFVNMGASYEFSSENTSLNRWMVWGKFGVSI